MPISVIAQATRRLCAPFLVVGVFVAAGCTPTAPAGSTVESTSAPEIQQGQLCWVNNADFEAIYKECKPGSKILFTPPVFGRESIPIMFIAGNCDMRYSVAWTNGAVTCIYAPLDETVANVDAETNEQKNLPAEESGNTPSEP